MTKSIITKNICISALIFLLLLLSGCPNKNDETYPVTQEEYLLGWVLHNINDSTPTNVKYTLPELSIYNISYNYPANVSRTYDNVLFWIAPFQWIAASTWVRFGVPQNRVYYLKGENVSNIDRVYFHGWSFYNEMDINYLTSEDEAIQFGLDVTQREHFKSEYPFDSIKPVPGLKEQASFGTAPFTPASVIVKPEAGKGIDILQLNDKILKGYNGDSYLKRATHLSVATYNESGQYVIKKYELTPPTYKIYFNNTLYDTGNLTDFFGLWSEFRLYSNLVRDGDYVVEINIPSFYSVFNTTKIKTNFTKKSGKTTYNLPVLKHIEFPPRFEINKPLPISLQFENETIIKKVIMYYKTDAMQLWKQFGYYNGTNLIIRDQNATLINFKFEAFTMDGAASYEVYPISLRSVNVACGANLRQLSGNSSLTFGKCQDAKGSNITGIRLEFYSDGKLLGSAMTDYNGDYTFRTAGWLNNSQAKFDGTGIYKSGIYRSTFLKAMCGNGIAEINESCDDGNLNNNDDCKNDCTSNTCGDGVLNLRIESCDDGTAYNDVCPTMCSASCTLNNCHYN